MKKFLVLASFFLALCSIPASAQTVTPPVVHGIQLMWGAPAIDSLHPPVAAYSIYRSLTTGGPYIKIGSHPAGSGIYLDSTGTPGTIYFYVVTAVDATGLHESVFSNEISLAYPLVAVVVSPAPNKPLNLRGGAI